MKTDEVYFAERAEEERTAAEDAKDKRARRSHLELAEAYEELSSALESAHQPSL